MPDLLFRAVSRSPSPLFGTFGIKKTALGVPVAALATPTNSSALPQMHRVSGRGRNVSGEGVKWAVSRGVWPQHRRGDSGTANTAAPKDSTTRAAKDGPVWSHCSAPAMRYEGKCGADSAHANHSENELSMKGLTHYLLSVYMYHSSGHFQSRIMLSDTARIKK